MPKPMASKKNREEDPARITELDREEVELRRSTLISGVSRDEGDSVEVAPFQRRHMVEAGYVDGGYEDVASEAEKGQGNLEVLKKPEDREGEYYSIEDLWERGDATGPSEHDVEAPSDPNATTWGSEEK